jgi:hypothetical protein
MAQARDEFIALDYGMPLDQASERFGLLAPHTSNLGNAEKDLIKASASSSSLRSRFRVRKLLNILIHWVLSFSVLASPDWSVLGV